MIPEIDATTGAGDPVVVTLGPDEAAVLLDWLMSVDLDSVAFGSNASELQALLGLLLQLDEQVDAAARTDAGVDGARVRLAQIQAAMDRDDLAAHRGREQSTSPPCTEKRAPAVEPSSDEALALAAERLGDPQSLQDTLQIVVGVARESLRGIDHAGITLAGPDAVNTLAATDDFARELDRLQYALGQGPCLDELDHHEAMTVVEFVTRGDDRWPRFAVEAAQMGLRSMMALRLFGTDTRLGVLNLYSTSHDTVDLATRSLALMFARHASIAYSNSRLTANLRTALNTRELVGQAVGVVMESHQLDAAEAFTYLVRVSSTTNTKMRDVAREVIALVEAGNRPGVAEDG